MNQHFWVRLRVGAVQPSNEADNRGGFAVQLGPLSGY